MDELAKRFADLATQYGPSVINAAKAAARMEAFSTLSASLMIAAFTVIFLLLARYLWNLETESGDDDIARAGAVACLVIAMIAGSFALWAWIDPWTWTALTHPEIWIAHKVLKI